MKVLACFLAFLVMCHADMYLHNMRGSNNRLNEQNRDRDNGNRLFDSQNNNRGGYNVGRVYYYDGEVTNQEWSVLVFSLSFDTTGRTSMDVATSTMTARSRFK
jgi:hypothetical protein